MQNGNTGDIVYEVKKELSVSNIMQLIDLNGTKLNFQSEFILTTVDTSKKISICVVNQDELDNGKINFEETERGKYSRRITYQNNKHVNHYIAVKKHPSDKEENNVDCLLVIHMKELPPKIQEHYRDREDNREEDNREEDREDREDNEMEYNLNPNMSSSTKEDIRKRLLKLRDDDEYRNMPIPESGFGQESRLASFPTGKESRLASFPTGKEDIDRVNSPELIDEESNQVEKKKSSFMNSYMVVGLIFLCIFAYIFYTKKIKK